MRRDRRGYVIVELLLVMSALLIIFGICVALMHGLLRLDRVARDHLAESATRDRLARQFRLDVRAASRSKPGSGEATPPDRLELGLPDGRVIDYRVLKGRIVRDEHDGPGDNVSHESYRLPSRAVPRFGARQEGKSLFVTLHLQRESAPGATRSLHDPGCEALLGKDLRFADRQEAAR
jgi:hypothetical protein